jgi:hypothetical protein
MKQSVGKGSVLAVVMFGKKKSNEAAEWCHRDNVRRTLVTGFLVSDSAHVLPGHTTKLLIPSSAGKRDRV